MGLMDDLKRIEEMRKLEDGWLDGEGERLDAKTIYFAKSVCSALHDAGLKSFAIFPTPDGEIQFEWSDRQIIVQGFDCIPEESMWT